MNLFLRAKHWQLFLLTFVLPVIVELIMMACLFVSIISTNNPRAAFSAFRYMPLIFIVFLVPLFCWQWSVGVGLQSKLPEGVKLKVNVFKAFVIIPACYMVIFPILIFQLISPMIYANTAPDPAIFISIFAIIPVHLFIMFCMFYCIWFIAKTFKTVELQREVAFSDYLGEFFLIWFFPIGIWFIQPKINEMTATPKSDDHFPVN